MNQKNLGEHQPTGTEARVCELIAARQRLGRTKYGTTVAQNPLSLRQWLVHQQEELADALVYCTRVIEELDRSGPRPLVAQGPSGEAPPVAADPITDFRNSEGAQQ